MIEIIDSNPDLMRINRMLLSQFQEMAHSHSTPITFCVIQESEKSVSVPYYFLNSMSSITANVIKLCIGVFPALIRTKRFQRSLDSCPKLKSLSIRYVHYSCDDMLFEPICKHLTELKIRFHHVNLIVELGGLPRLKILVLKKCPEIPFKRYFPSGLDSPSLIRLVIPKYLYRELPDLPERVKVEDDDSY
ncbi:unnamed protein product [Ambrosiozyma monospora]|uniref:Unnamed protein product n=1 Tax=Ambrosiozyma monospora TaxID=43982 RepID=A0A9W6YVT7_AMBMO|nr:unnamed protein product [Ambrosiozyma monospora]